VTKDLSDAGVNYHYEEEADAWVLPFIGYALLPLVMIGFLASFSSSAFATP